MWGERYEGDVRVLGLLNMHLTEIGVGRIWM